MKKRIAVWVIVQNILCSSFMLYGQVTDNWHYPLYLSNMNYWHARIPVVVENTSAQDVMGEPASMNIGAGTGKLHLAGMAASGIRVVDAKGNELLCRISSPGGKLITEGFLPDSGDLLLPVTIKAKTAETYYIYFDNPATWSTGAVLSCHRGVINSGFEMETENGPYGWRTGRQAVQQTPGWCREYPHSGEFCYRVQHKLPDSKTEAGFGQKDIYLQAGARYAVTGWVKAKELTGKAGWRVIEGNVASDNESFKIADISLDADIGTYDWKRVSAEFTVPPDVNSARVYPFLEGMGTAWFDDIQIVCLTHDALNITILPTQKMNLKEEGKNEDWPSELRWNIRVPFQVTNFGETKPEGLPVYVKMDQVFQRLHDKINTFSPLRLGGKSLGPFFRFENALVVDENVSAQTERTNYIYAATGEKQDLTNQQKEYARWLKDKRNLAGNSDVTRGISILPGHTYMFGGMAKCRDIKTDISVKVKFQGAGGKTLGKQAGSDKISGNTDWTYLSGICKAPEEALTAQIILSRAESGTADFKGIIMMEVMEGRASSMFFDQRETNMPDLLSAWPVNPIVKVFHEDLPPERIAPARITVARNETEPLQLAFRSTRNRKNMRVEVTAPVNSGGRQLDDVTVSVEGYVPIDYPSNYYGTTVPYWYLKYPDQDIGSDGWAGWWPDPLLPRETFDLAANTTQPVWIEVKVPEETTGGDYTGKIKVFQQDSLIKEVPWTVHVWNFALPQKNTFGASYDLRDAADISDSGMDQFRHHMGRNEFRDMYWSFMAKHRINAGEIIPAPVLTYKDGETQIDFTEYDKAAAYYFDELKNPFAYMPDGLFYLFGWAFPPDEKFNEKPYAGEYPYENADRGVLRPEYKQAYQRVLKVFWDHVKEKGWADRYVLYLSDEPHMAENSKADIVAQMKALCTMIHDVSRDIPIYVSTWNFRPEWEGYIDIWGVAFNGGEAGNLVPIEDYEHMKKSGDRIWFTTDGNFCTETPYMAVERLLPYFGYKYGAQAYEFWGVNWLTYNPYKFGWHGYIFESQAPGESSWKRYPNGDGFVIYPGQPIGQEGLVASIRLKQVREGAEDYEYLNLLGKLIDQAKLKGQSVMTAQKAMKQALSLVNIPCAMGRYSTRILKNPDDVYVARDALAKSIEELGSR